MACGGCARRRAWLLKKQEEAKAKIKAFNDNRVEGQGQRTQPGIRPGLAQHTDMDTQAG